MKFRKFQVRQFGGEYPEFQKKEQKVYSVIMHVDKPEGTKVYEHKTFINLTYDEALEKANLLEENLESVENLCLDNWTELDSI